MSYKKPLTLRELHARLGEIIANNEKRFPERNDAPVYVRVEQPKTPKGRLRSDVFIPIHFGSDILTRFDSDESGHVNAMCLLASRIGNGW